MAAIMVLHHNGGGGVEHYINQWKHRIDVPIFEAYAHQQGLKVVWHSKNQIQSISYHELSQFLKEHDISELHLHHLWNIELKKLYAVLEDTVIPYKVWIHDFYAICPYLFFINQKGTYCGMPHQERVCNQCAAQGAKRKHMSHMLTDTEPRIEGWRQTFAQILLHAKQVIAASESSKGIVNSYFPDVVVDVVPHPVQLSRTLYSPSKVTDTLRVAVLGNIYYHKGEKELSELLEVVKHTNLPVQFHIFGETGRTLTQMKTAQLTKHGPYRTPDQLADLLLNHQIDLVLIPSICPETFSYTTHEALALGYPVLCFDLGAQAEVVKKSGCGWVVPAVETKALYLKLTELSNTPTEVENMRNRAYDQQKKM